MLSCPLTVLQMDCLPPFLAQRALIFDKVQEDLNVGRTVIVRPTGPPTFGPGPWVIFVVVSCVCALGNSLGILFSLAFVGFGCNLATCAGSNDGRSKSTSLGNCDRVMKLSIW